MTPPIIPQLEGLDRLAFRNGVDIRPTLIRVLTDLYIQKPAHTLEEELHYTELLLRLVDAVDMSTRAVVARKLATYDAAPTAVVRRLARDVFEVAAPLLEHSSRLDGSDLVALIQQFDPRYAAIIARRRTSARRGIATDASGANGAHMPLAEASGPGLSAAAGSAGAEARRIIDAVTDQDQSVGGRGAGSNGIDLPLGELFLAAAGSERRMILSNLEDVAADIPAQLMPSNDAIRVLEAAALQRRPEDFVDEIERAFAIGRDLALRIVHDPVGEPLLVAVKALGMPAEVLLRILLFLDPAIGQSVARVFDLARLYDRLAPAAALRVMASLCGTAPAERRAASYRPLHWDDDADRARRNASEAARRPAGKASLGVAPDRRHGTT